MIYYLVQIEPEMEELKYKLVEIISTQPDGALRDYINAKYNVIICICHILARLPQRPIAELAGYLTLVEAKDVLFGTIIPPNEIPYHWAYSEETFDPECKEQYFSLQMLARAYDHPMDVACLVELGSYDFHPLINSVSLIRLCGVDKDCSYPEDLEMFERVLSHDDFRVRKYVPINICLNETRDPAYLLDVLLILLRHRDWPGENYLEVLQKYVSIEHQDVHARLRELLGQPDLVAEDLFLRFGDLIDAPDELEQYLTQLDAPYDLVVDACGKSLDEYIRRTGGFYGAEEPDTRYICFCNPLRDIYRCKGCYMEERHPEGMEAVKIHNATPSVRRLQALRVFGRHYPEVIDQGRLRWALENMREDAHEQRQLIEEILG